jgi:osmotically-inducible protein OsmY
MSQTKDIRDAVELELGYDPLVDDSDVTVKNISGDVALNGTVPSYPQYLEAAAAARRVAGVKKLQNHLEVVLPAEDYRDDATLTTTANNALIPDDSDVTVGTSGNTVTLSGHVRTWAEHDAVIDAAWMATGVYDVRDDLYVTG